MTGSPVESVTRRTFITTLSTTILAGCLSGPSSGGPRYQVREIDDGAVYEPGLHDETTEAFFAALVSSEEEADAFDLERIPREADRAFIRETEFESAYLGVVQVAGLNSSMVLRVVDIATSRANLTVVVAVDDPTPYSDDRVITTLLVRVTRDGAPIPGAIQVELSIRDRQVTFSGE